MAIIVNQQNLANLTGEAWFLANATLVELDSIVAAISTLIDTAVIGANYLAISQIIDDLARIADTVSKIHSSLSRGVEQPT